MDDFLFSCNQDKYIISADGTPTFYNHSFNACYHSLRDGALKETLHKHIYPPMHICKMLEKETLYILDICFGLGYNSFCTALEYYKAGFLGNIHIISPEIDKGVLDKISLFKAHPWQGLEIGRILEELRKDSCSMLLDNIKLEVIFDDAFNVLNTLKQRNIHFNVIYHDAFSRRSTPRFWDLDFFLDLYSLLLNDGVMTSYSLSKATINTAIKAGFFVYVYNSGFCQKSALFLKSTFNDKNLIPAS